MKKKKFNYLNFMYGIGAAIVIAGAMAKFLDMKYSNEIFIIGLGIEVVVFIISSIDFTYEETNQNIEYKWENVFPELLADKDTSLDFLKKGNSNDYSDIIAQKQMLTNKLKEIQENINELNKSFGDLTNSTDKTSSSMVLMNDVNKEYEKHMVELKQNMKSMNEFFVAFNSAVESVK